MASRASTAIKKLIGLSSILIRNKFIAGRVNVLLILLNGDNLAFLITLKDGQANAFLKETAFIAAGQTRLVQNPSAGVDEVGDELMD